MGFFVADSADILDAAATNANRGISSASHDGKSSSALSPLAQLEFADKLAARESAAAGVAANNGVGRILGLRAKARFGSTIS